MDEEMNENISDVDLDEVEGIMLYSRSKTKGITTPCKG